MKTRKFLNATLLFVLSLPLCGLAEPIGPESDRKQLRETFEKWIAAYHKRDLAGCVAIFADDVSFSFQGTPDAKKADLEKSYRGEFTHPESAGEWVPQFEEFECSGDLGFVRSTWKLEAKTADGKTEIKSQNRSVDILRREKDGQWRIFRSLNYPLVPPKKN
jgi:uncharacterized protein (TIGR02246 family)